MMRAFDRTRILAVEQAHGACRVGDSLDTARDAACERAVRCLCAAVGRRDLARVFTILDHDLACLGANIARDTRKAIAILGDGLHIGMIGAPADQNGGRCRRAKLDSAKESARVAEGRINFRLTRAVFDRDRVNHADKTADVARPLDRRAGCALLDGRARKRNAAERARAGVLAVDLGLGIGCGKRVFHAARDREIPDRRVLRDAEKSGRTVCRDVDLDRVSGAVKAAGERRFICTDGVLRRAGEVNVRTELVAAAPCGGVAHQRRK